MDYDTWERSTNIAGSLVEDGDACVYFGVEEYYVGTYKENGGNGLRTTRYEFYVHDEDDTFRVGMPITPWQMIEIGRQFLNGGLTALREQAEQKRIKSG